MSSQTPTIEVYEPDQRLARLIVRELTVEGYTIYRAANTADAERLCASERPNLLILDEEALQPNTVAAVSKFRQSAPVLLLLARHVDFDWRHNEADDVMRKPFSFDELLGRVRRMLQHGGSSQ